MTNTLWQTMDGAHVHYMYNLHRRGRGICAYLQFSSYEALIKKSTSNCRLLIT